MDGDSFVLHNISNGDNDGRFMRSSSFESDTIIADIAAEEEYTYSSDEEWEYINSPKATEPDYSHKTKTIKKKDSKTVRDAMEKERQIMKELYEKDIESRRNMDVEPSEPPLNDKDSIESLFVTEIQPSDVKQEGSIEVIDIVEEEGNDCIKSSLKLRFSTNEKIVVAQRKDEENAVQSVSKSSSQEIKFPWNIKLIDVTEVAKPLGEVKVVDGDLRLDMKNKKPGSYKFKFLINSTSFCDESLPFEKNYFGSNNIFIIWSNNFPTKKSAEVKIDTSITIPWKIQLVGTWEEPKIIECEACSDGDVLAKLPELAPGLYRYNFLINDCHFVDESLPFEEDHLANYNLLLVEGNGKVSWKDI